MPYYYCGRSGDSFVDATMHTTDDCLALDDPVRPVAESSVDADATEWCPDCGLKGDDGTGETAVSQDHPDPEAAIEDGVCPWCPPSDRYEGEYVGSHASSAHPDAWDDYRGE